MQAPEPHQLPAVMPPLVFRHFWLIAAVFMAINVAVIARRLPAWIAAGAGTPEEGRRFLRAMVLVLVAPGIVLELLSLAAGWSSPFCLTMAPWTPLAIAVRFLVVAAWIALLAWAWSAAGSDLLARFAPMLSRTGRPGRRFSPANVRLVVTLMVVVGAVSFAIQSSTVFAAGVREAGPFSCGVASRAVDAAATADGTLSR